MATAIRDAFAPKVIETLVSFGPTIDLVIARMR
jgi:hypothetical protein